MGLPEICLIPAESLQTGARQGIMHIMRTLGEIEEAVVKLAAEDQKHLLHFLLRVVSANETGVSAPRIYSTEEIQSWLAEDESAMRPLAN
jgi:hypothetical protein